MNKIGGFQEYLATESVNVPLLDFSLNMILAGLLAYIMGRVYTVYGSSLSNRSMFSKNFVLLTLITMLVITIVKSSLALSLGLVGALSIVRFRAAIKEPEELMYLFFAIGIGLGFGANQPVITSVAFLLILTAIVVLKKGDRSEGLNNIFLTLSTSVSSNTTFDTITNVLTDLCPSVQLKRMDEEGDAFEATFVVQIDDIEQLNNIKEKIKTAEPDIKITFLDCRGMA